MSPYMFRAFQQYFHWLPLQIFGLVHDAGPAVLEHPVFVQLNCVT